MIAITAVAVIVVAAGVGIGVKELNKGPGTPVYGMLTTGSTPQQDGQQVAAAFLSAWRSGNLTAAAKLTDQHVAAKAYLAANAKSLDLSKMTATTDSVAASANSTSAAPSETAKFTVTADGGGQVRLHRHPRPLELPLHAGRLPAAELLGLVRPVEA